MFDRSDVVTHVSVCALAVVNPTVPASTDKVVVPLAMGIFLRDRPTIAIELAEISDAFVVPGLGRGRFQLRKILAAFQLISGTYSLQVAAELFNLGGNFLCGVIDGVTDMGFNDQRLVVPPHLLLGDMIRSWSKGGGTMMATAKNVMT